MKDKSNEEKIKDREDFDPRHLRGEEMGINKPRTSFEDNDLDYSEVNPPYSRENARDYAKFGGEIPNVTGSGCSLKSDDIQDRPVGVNEVFGWMPKTDYSLSENFGGAKTLSEDKKETSKNADEDLTAGKKKKKDTFGKNNDEGFTH